jgi:chromosome segregation ATPase
LELAQKCRHDDREKLSHMDLEVRTLKDSIKKNHTDHERFRENTRKAMDKLHTELAECKSQAEMTTQEVEALTSDYGNAMTDLDLARTETTRVESERSELNAEYNVLKKEFQVCQSSLLSSRTTQKVENDRIQKAVQKAVFGKDEQLKKLRVEMRALKEDNEKLEKFRVIDEKTMRELSQDKLAQKEKNVEKEEKLSDLAAVQVALEQEVEIERKERKALEQKLSSLQSLAG